jgi:FAD/FMN-containing dehydrogenase
LLAKLNTLLREQNQFLPLLVPYYSQATIGGTIAAGLDSPLRNAYGTARDFLLGAEFIDGNGAQIKTGGRVVKNVTGYDLHKLLIGSCGTLAVITRLNFRTFPTPNSTQGFLAAFPDYKSALSARNKIIHSPLNPLTLDVLNSQAARLFDGNTNGTAPAPQIDSNHWYLFAEFSGNEDLLARYKRELAEIADQSQAGDMHILDDPATLAAMASRLREAIPYFRENFDAPLVVKLALPPAQHTQAATVLQSLADAAKFPFAIIARASGPILVATSSQSEQSASEGTHDSPIVSLFAREILTLARSFGGRAQLISAPPQIKSAYRAIFNESLASERSLAKRIKSAFDPNNLFPTLDAPVAPPTPPKSGTSPAAHPSPEPASQTENPPSPPTAPPSTPS